MSKSDLKVIIKECIVEILGEGLAATKSTPEAFSRMPRQTTQRETTSQKRSSSNSQQVPSYLSETIKREAGGNKVMEAILADTAASTLPKFLESGSGKSPMPSTGGGLIEQVVAQATPEDIFGDDATSKWAALAFMDSPIKK